MKPGYNVLLLHSESRLSPSVINADQAFRAALEAQLAGFVHFYTEFLDLNALPGHAVPLGLRDLLHVKYRARPIDLVVAQGQLTVPFVLENRARLFYSAPVVFVAVEASTFARSPAESAVTGTWRRQGWKDTLDLARRLHPDARRAAVVVGSSTAERFWLDAAREQLAADAGAIELVYLVDRSLEDILAEIAALPEHAVVLVGPFLRDGAGREFTTPAAIHQMAAIARVPLYGLTEGAIGSGVIGGSVVSFEAHGGIAAALALRVLDGERPAPTAEGTTVPMFDDRQIRRWKIDRRRLPAGSVLRFRPPSLWDRCRRYVALIDAAVVQRSQHQRPPQNVVDLMRFEVVLSGLSAALASCPSGDIDSEIQAGLRRIVNDLGTDRAILWSLDDRAGGARLTHAWTRPGVPPMPAFVREDRLPWLFTQIRLGHVARLPSPDGASEESLTDRQTLAEIETPSVALAPLVEGGVVVGALSVATVLNEHRWPDALTPRLRLLADVFASVLARQKAERAAREREKDIRDLAGRLMTAGEDERRRIARQLHDGVNQDIAALSIALSALERGLPAGTPDDRRQEVARLHERAVELSEAIRHLSHELHPGILEYAGLVAALRSHCREFEAEHRLALTFLAGDDLGSVPPDLALCLYRVTQEALKNAARYAKARHAWVNVSRDGPNVALTIRDDGRGFDLAEVRGQGGLGLISLDERVRLVGGRIAIDTSPGRGTELRVVVPLGPTARGENG